MTLATVTIELMKAACCDAAQDHEVEQPDADRGDQDGDRRVAVAEHREERARASRRSSPSRRRCRCSCRPSSRRRTGSPGSRRSRPWRRRRRRRRGRACARRGTGTRAPACTCRCRRSTQAMIAPNGAGRDAEALRRQREDARADHAADDHAESIGRVTFCTLDDIVYSRIARTIPDFPHDRSTHGHPDTACGVHFRHATIGRASLAGRGNSMKTEKLKVLPTSRRGCSGPLRGAIAAAACWRCPQRLPTSIVPQALVARGQVPGGLRSPAAGPDAQSGDAEFNYLLGRAALGSGRAEEAQASVRDEPRAEAWRRRSAPRPRPRALRAGQVRRGASRVRDRPAVPEPAARPADPGRDLRPGGGAVPGRRRAADALRLRGNGLRRLPHELDARFDGRRAATARSSTSAPAAASTTCWTTATPSTPTSTTGSATTTRTACGTTPTCAGALQAAERWATTTWPAASAAG